MKRAREVSGLLKAALLADLDHRQGGVLQQLARTLDAQTAQVAVGRLPGGGTEEARELDAAEAALLSRDARP